VPAATPAFATPSAATSAPATASVGGAPTNRRFVLGLRPVVGWSIAMGGLAKGSKLKDMVVGVVPVWLDLGYMVTPNLMVGLYALYATLPDFSRIDIRLGVQALYHPLRAGIMDPWFGLGIGYERLKASETVWTGFTSQTEYSQTLKGIELANLQAGLDFKPAPMIGVGPYVSFSLGQYWTWDSNVPYGGGRSGSIDQKAIHEWLTFGVHAALYL
jgi:hypothetical protein